MKWHTLLSDTDLNPSTLCCKQPAGQRHDETLCNLESNSRGRRKKGEDREKRKRAARAQNEDSTSCESYEVESLLSRLEHVASIGHGLQFTVPIFLHPGLVTRNKLYFLLSVHVFNILFPEIWRRHRKRERWESCRGYCGIPEQSQKKIPCGNNAGNCFQCVSL